jgi:hypothetical protein
LGPSQRHKPNVEKMDILVRDLADQVGHQNSRACEKMSFTGGPEVRHACRITGCSETFSRKADKKRHEEEVHGPVRYCSQRGCSFAGTKRKSRLDTHMREKHPELIDGKCSRLVSMHPSANWPTSVPLVVPDTEKSDDQVPSDQRPRRVGSPTHGMLPRQHENIRSPR